MPTLGFFHLPKPKHVPSLALLWPSTVVANLPDKGLDRLNYLPCEKISAFVGSFSSDGRPTRKVPKEEIMKYLATPLIALAFGLAATQAQAQDAASPPQPDTSASAAQSAPPAAATPDAGATAQTATTVSDIEVDQFAQATVKVQKINADTKLAESAKQKQMAAAVKAAGMDPARFNEIGKAVAGDTALRAKVQMAMAKYAGPSKG
jgi:hypothetical protein